MNTKEKLQMYKGLKDQLQPQVDKLKQLEKEIKAEILETGEVVSIDGIETKIRTAYTRSTWDNKMLRGHAVMHPEILTFVKETIVKSFVVFKGIT